MKKSLLYAIVCVTFILSSCKKDYVCECNEIRTNNNGSTVSTPDEKYTFKDTRARAESRCVEQESSGSDIFGAYSIECEIK